MSTERKGVEFLVGLFLLIGFGVIAAMVIIFGRMGQGMQDFYSLRVRFPNASGLVRGADVLLSGARIGTVSNPPTLVGERYEVEVEISIRGAVQIPRTALFQIRSSGMLGDSYVDVHPPATFTEADYAKPKELIIGQRTGGLDDLTSKGAQMMDTLNTDVLKKVSAALDEIKGATSSINEKLLSDANLKNLEGTFANLKTTTEDFSKTARDLDIMVNRAQEVVDSAKGTMKTVDSAASDIRLAIGDYRKTADSARTLFDKAAHGDGPLGTLIGDKQTAENLKSLVTNLRKSGVLFYKDRAASSEATPATPAPNPRRR